MPDREKTKEELIIELHELRAKVSALQAAQASPGFAEKALEELLATSAEIVQAVPSGLFIFQHESDDRLHLVNGNPEARRLTGIHIEQWRDRDIREMWPDADSPGLITEFINVLKNGGTFETGEVVFKRDGLERMFRIRAFRIAGDRLGVFLEDVTDIKKTDDELREARNDLEKRVRERTSELTKINRRLKEEINERRRAEKALQESEAKYRDLFENAGDILYTLDTGGRCTSVNGAIERVLGFKPATMIDTEFVKILDPEHIAEAKERLNEQLTKPEEPCGPYEVLARNVGNEPVWLEITTRTVGTNGRLEGVHGIARDINPRKRVEEQLRDSEARYRTMVENSPLGILSCDTEGGIIEINPRLLKTLGLPSVHAKHSLNMLTFAPLVEAGIAKAMKECLQSGRVMSGEFRYKGQWGKRIPVRIHLAPFNNSEGKIAGFQMAMEDISEMKSVQDLLMKSERFKAVGEIAGGAAHTFNNVLQIVSANANLALSNLEAAEYDEVRQSLKEIVESSKAGAETARRLQHFARPRPLDAVQGGKVFDLSETAREGVATSKLWSSPASRGSHSGAEPTLDLQQDCFVAGHQAELIEVVVNFLKNAVEAMPEGGRIVVRTFAEKDKVLLQIKDEGVGIPENKHEDIFQPFRTTKEGHAGMGLAVNLGIVRQHGGKISVKSAPGKGSTFTVSLPRAEHQPGEVKAPVKKTVSERWRILLIDDDEPVLRILGTGLARLGQTAVTANSGMEGLDRFEEAEFDAVVCDLAMEELSGWEVSTAIRAACVERGIPKPPFIMLTGWAGQLSSEVIAHHPDVDRIVDKPVTIDKLLQIITEEIRKATGD